MRKINILLTTILVFLFSFSNAQWTKIEKPATQGIGTSVIAKNEKLVLIGTRFGIFRSEDNGKTWNKVSNFSFYLDDDGHLLLEGDTAYAWKQDHAIFSIDKGKNWDSVSIPDSMTSNIITTQFFLNDRYYLEMQNGAFTSLYYSDDWGDNWHLDTQYRYPFIEHFYIKNDLMLRYYVDSQFIRVARDSNNFFKRIPTQSLAMDLTSYPVSRLKGDLNDLYAYSNFAIFKYSNQQEYWDTLYIVNSLNEFISLNSVFGDTVIAASYNSAKNSTFQYLVSADGGQSWRNRDFSRFSYPIVSEIIKRNGKLWGGSYKGIYTSNNLGRSWQFKPGKIHKLTFYLSKYKGKVLASNLANLYQYMPSSNSFSKISTPLDSNKYAVYPLNAFKDRLYLAGFSFLDESNDFLYFINKLDGTWNKIHYPGKYYNMISVQDDFIALENNNDSIYISNDGGKHWNIIKKEVKYQNLSGLTNYKNGLLVGLAGSIDSNYFNFHVSKDQGKTWEPIKNKFPNSYYYTFKTLQDKIFVFPRADNGLDSIFSYQNESWKTIHTQGLKDLDQISLVKVVKGAFYLVSNRHVWVSYDQGKTWEQKAKIPEPNDQWTTSMVFTNEKTLLGKYDGIYRTASFSSDKSNLKKSKSAFKLFPNPVNSNKISIRGKFENDQGLMGTIYNSRGKKIKSFNWDVSRGENKIIITIPKNLPIGTYLLQLNGENQVYSKKFIKN